MWQHINEEEERENQHVTKHHEAAKTRGGESINVVVAVAAVSESHRISIQRPSQPTPSPCHGVFI